MSFIHMPPKFLSPYSGTELGSAGNVFCKQVSTTTGGVGTVVDPPKNAADATVTLTTTGVEAIYTTAAIPASSTTSVSGTGLKALFTVNKNSGGANAAAGLAMTLNITASGTGYVSGDTVTFSLADLADAFNDITALSISAATAAIVFTFAAGIGNSLTYYGNAGETGWQTTLPATSTEAQLLTIVLPDDGVDTNDFDDQDYVIVCNATAGTAETLTASIGTLSASIHHNGTLNTDIITVRRGTTGGKAGGGLLEALVATDITVRLVKRQLSTA